MLLDARPINNDEQALRSLRDERRIMHRFSPHLSSEISWRCHMVYEFEQWRPRAIDVSVRIAQVHRIHEELKKLNLRVRVVDHLNKRHIDALRDHWRATLSSRVAKLLWDALAWWAEFALGKSGMIEPYSKVWQTEPNARACEEAKSSRRTSNLRTTNRHEGSQTPMPPMRNASNIGGKRLATSEAHSGMSVPRRFLVVQGSQGRTRVVPIDTPEREKLVRELEKKARLWGPPSL